MAISIYDVAKEAGVSISTVSRVLNGSAGVRPQKLKAVQKAIETLQYVPNTMARGLATRSSSMVGITSMFNCYETTYTTQLLKGFMHYIDATPYSVVLINDPNKDSTLQGVIPSVCMGHIDQRRIDALFYAGTDRPSQQDPCYNMVVEKEFPFAYIGPLPPDGTSNPPNVFSLYAQLETYVHDVLRRFADLGHRRLAVLYFDAGASGHKQKLENAIKRARKELGMDTQLYSVRPDRAATVRDTVEAIVRDKRTALFTTGLFEVGQLMAILRARGIRVPEDLSLCSVEHLKGEGEILGIGLDCVYVPAFEMGYTGARLLCECLQGRPPQPPHVLLEPEYIARHSVQALR